LNQSHLLVGQSSALGQAPDQIANASSVLGGLRQTALEQGDQ
jgi:hypothetical protein